MLVLTFSYEFCRSRYYQDDPSRTIAAKGYLRIPLDTSANSEAAGDFGLYANSGFTSRNSMLDYVCWGTLTGPNRKSVAAQQAGDGAAPLWSGDCAASVGSGLAIIRKKNVAGSGAGDYDTAATPVGLTCPASQ